MPRKTEATLESRIHEIVAQAAAEIAASARREMSKEVQRILEGALVPVAAAGTPKPRAARAQGPATAAPARPAAKFVRRTPAEIAAENDRLYAFVKANPGLRSEVIQKRMGLPKPTVASGLQRLRDEGRVSMTGIKRAATYTAI